MKIVCCDNEMEFKETNNKFDDSIHAHYDSSKFNIVAEHDEVWITCLSCGHSIHINA